MQITANTVVSIDYTLTNARGEVLDSSEGREPLAYLQGHQNIIPGLEAALEGKSAGDQFEVSIPPEEAYGQRDESLRQNVSRSLFEQVDQIEVGMQFRAGSDQGEHVVTVVAVDAETIVIDANHPLAGETLNFAVTVVDVRAASSEEQAHGHAHGPGGHTH